MGAETTRDQRILRIAANAPLLGDETLCRLQRLVHQSREESNAPAAATVEHRAAA